MSLLNSYLIECKRVQIGELSDLLLSFNGVEAYVITDNNCSLTVIQVGKEYFQLDYHTVEPYCLTSYEEAVKLSKDFKFETVKNETVTPNVITLKEYVKRRTDDLLTEIAFMVSL